MFWGGVSSLKQEGQGEAETALSPVTRAPSPAPVALLTFPQGWSGPGESQGPGSLVGFRLWGHTESDTSQVS